MMKFLEQTSKRTPLIVLFIAQIVVGAFLGLSLSNLSETTSGSGILDFEVGYSFEHVNELFESYGSEGMRAYHQIQFIDLFNPLIYSLLFSSLMFLFLRNTRFQLLSLFGFLCGLLDYFENFFLYRLSNSFPELSENLVSISSAISVVKHSVLYLTILIFIVAIVNWIRKR